MRQAPGIPASEPSGYRRRRPSGTDALAEPRVAVALCRHDEAPTNSVWTLTRHSEGRNAVMADGQAKWSTLK